MKLFDTHAHLNFGKLYEDSEELISELSLLHIYVNIVGVDYETSLNACNQALKHRMCFASVGIHPNNADELLEEELNNQLIQIEKLINSDYSKKIVCIGETGLDYSHENHNKAKQIESLKLHIQISKKYNKTLNLHCRDADKDLIEIIKKENIKPIIHCFSSNIDNASQYVETGCFLSIPGIVTFEKALELKHAIQYIPLENILIETDSPYLAPHPVRGKVNTPKNLIHILKEIAKIKNIDEKILAKKLFDNSLKAFKINLKDL